MKRRWILASNLGIRVKKKWDKVNEDEVNRIKELIIKCRF